MIKIKEMKTMKSIAIIAVLFLANISYAQPQGGGRGGQQGPPPTPNDKQIKEMVSDLADEIKLSDDQEAEILELYQDHFSEVEEKTSGNSRPKREEMEALTTKLEDEVKALLTTDQQKEYTAYLKKNQRQGPRK